MKFVRKQFAVVGLGIFGRAVASTLRRMGHEVLGVDVSEHVVQMAHDERWATHVAQADALSASALRELGIAHMDAVVVAIRASLENSILAVHNLTELGVKRMVARAVNSTHARVLERVGGPHLQVVIPEAEMGRRIAQRLAGQEALETLTLDPYHSIVEVPAPSDIVGQTMAELRFREKYGVLVLAIRRGHKLVQVPSPKEPFEVGDRLVLLGEERALRAFTP